ncbi:MAG TPA: hypothetical protein VGC66_11770 [Pyrinomonadaceae bacterium]|jgi:hypothetical protein
MPDDAQSNAGVVEFMQYHKPGLPDGDYVITVTQTVSVADTSFTATKNFTVAGERFELNPSDIHAVFPPDGNLGEHYNVLPHIILNRSTLPWERRAQDESSDVPWLALLLFDETEKPQPRILTVDELLKPLAGAPKFPALALEKAQHREDKLTVIDIKKSLLEGIMPTAEELRLLAHVRLGKDPEQDPTGEELAVIISSRLPQKGKGSTAHLVSIEGRLKQSEFDYQGAGQDDLIRLISLKSWSFTCEDPKKSFKGLLLNLNQRGTPPNTLRLPESANVAGNAQAEKFLSRGYVLLPHHLRHRDKTHGGKTASWYHGPLIPGESTSPEISLPVPAADELLRYDPAISMFDISYAAAWEMGRLLALQNKAFSTSLYQWKRLHAQQLAQVEEKLTHLPFQKTTTTEAPPLPDTVSSWFESLRKLEGIPFDYLVPDERMLPVESIRFFRVDNAWVGCLLDGAFSIGRVASSDYVRDQSHGEKSPAATPAETVTGFLLRSEVVAGWPSLLVDAYSDQEGNHPIISLRMERLSAGVLICLFKGEMKRVEIHQKPETLHFGFDEHTENEKPPSGFYKNLRDPNSGSQLISGDPLTNNVEVNAYGSSKSQWRSDSQRVLNVSSFAQAIKDKLLTDKLLEQSSPFTSAQFALQMVEGVEKIIFVAQT